MEINTDNAKRIEAYIASNKECIQNITEPVSIKDQREDIPVYRLPTNLILFNVRNGRFAAEYKELVQKEGRELDSEDPEDSKKIQKMLLEPGSKQESKQTNILMSDIKRFGQKYPGIMTWDGYLINGNRRMAVLNKLKDDGEDEWGYILVGRLPKGVSQKDLWKIEAGIQLSRQEKLDYGPINTLLKLREGKDAGLTEAQIAKSLYGGFTEDEIKESLKRLELIENYLEYIGQPKNYKKAEGVHEHFIVLYNILLRQKKDRISSEDLLKIQKIAFQLIKENIPQMKLRLINRFMEEDKAKENFLKAEEHLSTITPTLQIENEKEEKSEEDEDEEDGKASIVRTIFNDSVDIYEAARKKDEPLILLIKALRNLEEIELSSPHLKDESVKKEIKKITDIVDKLKQFL